MRQFKSYDYFAGTKITTACVRQQASESNQEGAKLSQTAEGGQHISHRAVDPQQVHHVEMSRDHFQVGKIQGNRPTAWRGAYDIYGGSW